MLYNWEKYAYSILNMVIPHISSESIINDLGFNLKVSRQKCNLTQKQLADELHTTQERICKIEHGKGILKAWELIYLIYFLKINFKDIDPLTQPNVWAKPDLRLDAIPAKKIKN